MVDGIMFYFRIDFDFIEDVFDVLMAFVYFQNGFCIIFLWCSYNLGSVGIRCVQYWSEVYVFLRRDRTLKLLWMNFPLERQLRIIRSYRVPAGGWHQVQRYGTFCLICIWSNHNQSSIIQGFPKNDIALPQLWGSRSEDLGSVEYSFIAIILKALLTRSIC